MRSPIIKICVAAAFVATAYCYSAYADSICDTALKSGAFNTSDYSQTSRLLLKKRDDACKSEYNSQSEATTAAQQSGASIGYGPFSLGGSDTKQTSSGKYSIADSKFCKASSEDIDSFTNTNAKNQVADTALNAWTDCIDKVDTNKLYVEYSPKSDGTGITGRILRSVRTGSFRGKITGIMGSGTTEDDKGITCKIGTTAVAIDEPVSIEMDKTKINITCNKDANKTALIAIITDQGDQDWMKLPSKDEQEQNRIDFVNDAVNVLRQQIASLEKLLVPVGSIIDWFRPTSSTSIPAGFQICDGSSINDLKSVFNGRNTPNLVDRFVMGVTSDRVGEMSGNNNINLDHTHKLTYCGGGGEGHFLVANAWTNDPRTPGCAERVSITTTTVTNNALNSVDIRPKYLGVLKLMRIW